MSSYNEAMPKSGLRQRRMHRETSMSLLVSVRRCAEFGSPAVPTHWKVIR